MLRGNGQKRFKAADHVRIVPSVAEFPSCFRRSGLQNSLPPLLFPHPIWQPYSAAVIGLNEFNGPVVGRELSFRRVITALQILARQPSRR